MVLEFEESVVHFFEGREDVRRRSDAASTLDGYVKRK